MFLVFGVHTHYLSFEFDIFNKELLFFNGHGSIYGSRYHATIGATRFGDDLSHGLVFLLQFV